MRWATQQRVTQWMAHEQLVTQLTFPETGLDLSRYMVQGGGAYGRAPAIYDLKSVALHSGGIGGAASPHATSQSATCILTWKRNLRARKARCQRIHVHAML